MERKRKSLVEDKRKDEVQRATLIRAPKGTSGSSTSSLEWFYGIG